MIEKTEFFYDLKACGIVDKLKKGLNISEALRFIQKTNDCVSKYEGLGGRRFFVKQTDYKEGVSAVASSKLYKNVGILTPPVYFVAKENNHTITTLQQDVKDIEDIETILANDDVEYKKIQTKPFGKFKWQLFYDEKLVDTLLKFMTPDCLTQLQNMYLVDELRTDGDKHLKNYFFYKIKNSDKYQGIIAVDLDLMQVYNYCGVKKDDFSNFLVYPYQTVLPHQLYDNVSYKQRMSDMRQLVQDGVLSASNISAISRALEFDYPQEMSKACKESKIRFGEKQEIVKPVERLWEYNRETIGKDLGL